MKKLVVATRNSKKLIEIKRLLRGTGIRALSLDEFDNLPKVKEDGATFRANAKKKALEISRRIDLPVLADDSGLEVPALKNAPGINSARYAGPSQNDKRNIAKLLKSMHTLTGRKRRARFRCVIAISRGARVVGIAEGKVEGRISTQTEGDLGFGYDPVFVPYGFKKTFAEFSSRAKDRISHRGRALRESKKIIRRYFQRYP